MDYAASSADIEAPALSPRGTNSTAALPLAGQTRQQSSGRETRAATRIAARVAALCGCCTLLFCVLAPIAWIPFAFIVWAEHSREPCDQPLPLWLESYLLYSLLMPYCKAGILRTLCAWTPEASSESPPRRVKAFSHVIDGLPVFWMMLARLFIGRSRTCKTTSVALYHFVDWYSWFMLFFMIFRFVFGAFGLMLLQIWISRNGGDFPDWMQTILQKANAASPETINKIETVAYDAALFADPADPGDERPAGECCICLQPYNEELEIKRTQCGHLAHTECLEEWLKRARTCPTCRKDLEEACEESSLLQQSCPEEAAQADDAIVTV